jgi:HK97 family phage prohead protease
MATWTTAYVDSLPDSSFLYIEPGGKKDEAGKTEPRSLRHFPVKDENGNPDADHVRNALARIPDSTVPDAAKAEATSKAQAMLKSLNSGRSDEVDDLPPRDLLVRTSLPFEIVRSKDGMPVLHGRGAVYNEWTEINSRTEGHFMERFMPGAFTKTISEQRERIRCLFNHGQDPSIGMKPLGPITDLSERDDGVHYEVQMLDTDYCRSLVPGLKAGLYGSSFRFGTVRKNDERKRVSNPNGILERTITEAYMRELGPTPFPAYGGTSAAVRSLTDEFVLGRFPADELAKKVAATSDDRDLVDEMIDLARTFIASGDTDADAMRNIIELLKDLSGAHAPYSDAGRTATNESAATTSTEPLWGIKRDKEVAPQWRL